MLQCPRCGGKHVTRNGSAFWRSAGGSSGKQRYLCGNKKCRWGGTVPAGLAGAQAQGIDHKQVSALHKTLKKVKRFVITSAQNATPVHAGFFASLMTYCRENNAQLLVIPYRYKNVTSHHSKKEQGDDWWATELTGWDRAAEKQVGPNYLYNRRRDLDDHIMVLGDIMTQPTATRPLRGLETISGRKSAIIGHAKLELICVPTPQARLPKILTTTGSVTIRNYVPAKAGKKGEFHHTFGAAVVELADGLFHLRQINATADGTFMDLDTEYRPDSVERGIPLEALNMGDTHEEFVSHDVVRGTFGKNGIVPVLKPKKLIWHDLHDFYRRSHHHRGDPFTAVAKHRADMDDVEQGLRQTFAFLDDKTPAGCESIVVDSNHPNAFARWMKETDWRGDPVNAKFYLQTALAMVDASRMTANGAKTVDPFVYWGKTWLKANERVRFLAADESYQIKGIECTYHGHVGANGSRGSIRAFAKIGVKTIIGHSHTPGISDGVYQNGTSTPLKLEYTQGPSSWMNTHTAIYRNGKRCLINIVDGWWRA